MNKPYKLIVGVFLLVYLVHVLSFGSVFFFQSSAKYNGGTFCMTSIKGDEGLTMDMANYMAQIRDSWNHGFALFQRDPYVKENAGISFPNGNLVYAAASVFHLFSSSSEVVYFISVFVSLLIAAFLVYSIVELFVPGARTAKITFVFAYCFLYLLSLTSLYSFNNFIANITGAPGLMRNLGYTGRFPHIEFSLVFLIFWFYCWARYTVLPSVRNCLLLGVSLAILQYCYFYFWTGACFFTGIHLLFSLRNIKAVQKSVLYIFGVYLVLTLPFWIKFIQFNHTPFAHEFLERCRPTHSHKPQPFSIIMPLSAFLFLVDFALLLRRSGKINLQLFLDTCKQNAWSLYLFVCVYMLLNIQVITGSTVQPHHWESTFFYPVFILLCIPHAGKLSLLMDWISKGSRTRKMSVAFSVLFLLAMSAVLNNARFGKLWASSFYLTKSETELFNKIKNDLPANSVFMSNSFGLMGTLNARLGSYVYVPNGFVSASTNEELVARLVKGLKKIGYRDQQVKTELKKGEKWITDMADIENGKTDLSDSLFIPDNSISLAYMYGGSFYDPKVKTHVCTAALENQVDSLYALPSIALPSPDYTIIYKRILPADCHPDSSAELVFENTDFAVYKTTNEQ